jgi:ferredoxin
MRGTVILCSRPRTAVNAAMPELPARGPAGKARAAALASLAEVEVTPTSLVTYQSQGRLAVIGSEAAALKAARVLTEQLPVTVLVPGVSRPDPGSAEGIVVVRGGTPEVAGRLGRFTINLGTPEGTVALTEAAGLASEYFDLVLDLSEPPLIDYEVPPVGYYAPGTDPKALARALAELPEMSGEFEKPKYFNFKPELCAHSRSELPGCTRCIDACPTVAISSNGDVVAVDPYLCQGAGSCVAACPSGAMTYAFPTVSDLLGRIRRLFETYREAGCESPAVLLHDGWTRRAVLEQLAADMPEDVIPLEVEEVGSVGMDCWLAMLAYGARGVVLCITGRTPGRMVRELEAQIGFSKAVLLGMGFPAGALATLNCDQPGGAATVWAELPAGLPVRPARFVAPDDKRGILRLAIEHLHRQAPAPRKTTDLPVGAPFGEVRLNKAACTLCMGCVSVCPTAALTAGGDLPQLRFTEWNCVQCGLCEKACPEDAIQLNPRFLFDAEQRQQPRVLHEEPPFCCVCCGKPFTTSGLLGKVQRKLEGHWMFQTEEARRRLMMCEHCRVKDMFKSGRGSGLPPG